MALPIQTSLLSHMSSQLATYQPGAKSAEENSSIKSEISAKINNFHTVKSFELTGSDKMVRPIGVGIQTIFEQSLHDLVQQGKITKATAIIHTKMPTTPLCTQEKTVDPKTMAPQMQSDSAREQTFIDRTITLRSMAKQGEEMKLYVAYLKGGLKQRLDNQQEIYKSELANPENSSLVDLPLSHKEIPDDIVGASYIMIGEDKKPLYFGLKAVQVIEAGAKKMDWRFWLGSPDEPEIRPHYQEVKTYLETGTSTDLQLS